MSEVMLAALDTKTSATTKDATTDVGVALPQGGLETDLQILLGILLMLSGMIIIVHMRRQLVRVRK
jgi:hypothetical protein